MLTYLPAILTFVGAGLLAWSLWPVTRICRESAGAEVQWQVIRVLVGAFVLAYLVMGVRTLQVPADVFQLIRSLLFLGGSIFVWLVIRLSLHTVYEVKRITALEVENTRVEAERRRLASILDNTAEGIIVFDEDGIIETFNKAAERLFETTATSVAGQRIQQFLPDPSVSIGASATRGIGHLMGEGELQARALGGRSFPVAFHTGEMEIEDRRLFTCLVYDISEHKAMVEDLRRLAERDYLTGLYNRRYFMEELARSVERVKRTPEQELSLLYLDLDYFKQVNDTFGHLAGDRVLCDVAGLINDHARQADVVARLGGDEFGIIAHGTDIDTATAAAHRYQELISGYEIGSRGESVQLGCSVGIAELDPSVRDKEDALMRADLACQLAKRAGRRRVHIYNPEDRQRLQSFEL